MKLRASQLLVEAVAIASLAVGCVAPAGAVPVGSNATSAGPTASNPTSSQAADCYNITAQPGFTPNTIESLSKDAPDVVVGVFGGYGTAEWNTPTGKRPTATEVQDTTARLVRPLKVDINSTLTGSASPTQIYQRGGKLGCDSVTYDGDVELVSGQEYVYFMSPAADSVGGPTNRLLVLTAWPVAKDNTVDTQHDGVVSIDDLKKALVDGVAPPQETPNEPTTGPKG